MPFYAAVVALFIQAILMFGPPRSGYVREMMNDIRIITTDRKLQYILLGFYLILYAIVFLMMFFFFAIAASKQL